jgi:hypothetical protein
VQRATSTSQADAAGYASTPASAKSRPGGAQAIGGARETMLHTVFDCLRRGGRGRNECQRRQHPANGSTGINSSSGQLCTPARNGAMNRIGDAARAPDMVREGLVAPARLNAAPGPGALASESALLVRQRMPVYVGRAGDFACRDGDADGPASAEAEAKFSRAAMTRRALSMKHKRKE